MKTLKQIKIGSLFLAVLFCSCNKQASFSKRKYLPRFHKEKFVAKQTIKRYPKNKKTEPVNFVFEIKKPKKELELIASVEKIEVKRAPKHLKLTNKEYPILIINETNLKKSPLIDTVYAVEKKSLKVWQKVLYILGMLSVWFLTPFFIHTIEGKSTTRYKNSLILLFLMLAVTLVVGIIAAGGFLYLLSGLAFNFELLFWAWAVSIMILYSLLLYLGVKTVLKN